MKKKKITVACVSLMISIIVLCILFIPYKHGTYDDGGTREYRAVTYTVVKWNKISGRGKYKKTEVYWFRDAYKNIDELWRMKDRTNYVPFAETTP
jgi:hypothetical protein